MADKKEYTDLERNLGEILRGEDKVGATNAEQKALNSGYNPNTYDLSGATSTSSIDTDAVENALNNTVGTGEDKIGITDGKLSKDPLAGPANTRMKEKIPKYNAAPCETVNFGTSQQSLNNTWIILGRDRDKGFATGYGGQGHTRAGAIDIVVGLQGWNPVHGQVVEKNFGSMASGFPGDAARIYISQRADIDRYFDICDGSMGPSKAMSAIGIKADSVRIMGRKGIKIVTGQAPQQKTSLNGKLPAQFGIDLIAGNRDNVPAVGKSDVVIGGKAVTQSQPYLQPIPKGLNLRDCIETTIESITELNALLTDFIGRQMIINCALAGSPITGAAGPIPLSALSTAIPRVADGTIKQISNVFADLIKQQANLVLVKENYLKPTGAIYINSRYNRTN